MIKNIPILLIIPLYFLFSPTASAVFGASISYECLGANTYEVTLTAYQDCSEPPLSGFGQVLDWTGLCSPSSGNVNVVFVNKVDITPVCATANSSCSGGGGLGVDKYTYTGTLTLPVGCDLATVSWQHCCRNGAITSFNSPPAGLYVYAEINNTAGVCNNSVEFLSELKIRGDRNDPYFYNQGAFDADGDSLVYSLVDCQESVGTSVDYDFGGGYSGSNPIDATPSITLDPVTGQIEFGTTPPPNQRVVICVLVEEYRGNVKVGAVVRDFQYESNTNNTNNAPVVSAINVIGGYVTTGTVGTPISFFLEGTDLDAADTITMDWDNGIPSATFAVAPGTIPSAAEGTFSWTPTPSDAGRSHYFRVRIKDNSCPFNAVNSYAYRIIIPPLPPPGGAVEASPDTIICTGGTAFLNATTTSSFVQSFEWSPAIGLSDPNIPNPTASPAASTYYTVTLNYSNGDPSTTDVVLVTVEDPIIDIFPKTVDVCSGGLVSLVGGVNRNGLFFAWSDLNPTAPGHPAFTNGSPGNVNGSTSRLDFTMYSAPGNYKFALKAQTSSGFCAAEDSVEIRVNPAPPVSCSELYVTPIASNVGQGTKADPINLNEALRRSACGNVVIKMAEGVYTINRALNLYSNTTIEGGFLPSNNWRKTSEQGRTVINRSIANPEGTPNLNQRLVAIQAIGIRNFRLQDLTVTTDDAPIGSGISTYGIYLNSAEDYNITRVAVEAGDAGDGISGIDGCGRLTGPGSDPMDGGIAFDGVQGSLLGVFANGGNGAFGGGSGNVCGLPPEPPGGFGGVNLAPNGNAGASTVPVNTHGGAGGGGGAGGIAVVGLAGRGGPGGSGGGPNGNGATTAGGAAGSTRILGLSGTDGADGISGAPGTDGADGPDAAVGRHIGGFYELRSGVDGQNGQGGDGGGGGGGGGGRLLNGNGNGGGGGGAGGAGGFAGIGGRSGGASFGIYITNNGPNGFIEDCNIDAGDKGNGGLGGDGGDGGNGSFGGVGGSSSLGQLGRGGNGGDGGDGGNGGDGGDGADGIEQNIFWDGRGVSPLAQDSIFNLAGQVAIVVDDINCTNSNIRFENTLLPIALGNTSWNFDLITGTAQPNVINHNPGITSYPTVGRYTIQNGTGAGSVYKGFHNIAFPGPAQPIISTTAIPTGGPDTFRVCVGDAPLFSSSDPSDTIYWNFNGAIIPSNPGNVATVSGFTFNSAGFYPIELYINTACCGPSPIDTIWLHVVPVPNVAPIPDATICRGDSIGVRLLGVTNQDSVIWSPNSDVFQITIDSFVLVPSVTTTYTATIGRKLISGGQTFNTCPINTTTTISVTPTLTASIVSRTDVSCRGGFDGEATVQGIGGLGTGYTYQWDAAAGGQTTATVTGLPAGIYCVTVSEVGSACSDVICVTIQEPAFVVFINTIASTPTTCNGGADGTATALAQGGTPYTIGAAYDYVWSDGQTGPSIAGLAAGKYYVTATDSLGCEGIDSIIVSEPTAIGIAVFTTPIDCHGDSTGIISLLPTGGSGSGYTYQWDAAANNQTTGTIINLNADTYCVTVTDAFGCTATICETLVDPPVFDVFISTLSPISCHNTTDGSVAALAFGGTGTGGYTWSTGQSGATLTGLGAGTYTVTATDALNCTATDAITLIAPPALNTTSNLTPIVCHGDSTGEIELIVTGGTGPGTYTYLWSTGETTPIISNLGAGSYFVTITDGNGCINSLNVDLLQPPALGAPDIRAIDTVICEGGEIRLGSFTSGANHFWAGPNGWMAQGQFPVIPIAGTVHDGIYTLSLEANNGCFYRDTSIRIVVNPSPTAPTLLGGGTTCFNDVIVLTAAGGTCDSLYFNGPVSTVGTTDTVLQIPPFVPNHQTGLWTLTCVDTVTGCQSESAPILVNVPPSPPQPIINSNSPICAGDTAVFIAPNVFGATSEWFADSNRILSFGIFDTLLLTNLVTTDTIYLVQTVNGCPSPIGQTIINVDPKPAIPLIITNSPVCENERLQFLTTSSGPIYEWRHEFNGLISTQQNPFIDPVMGIDSGEYTLVVTNNLGCSSDTGIVQVTINSAPFPPVTNTNSPLCDGDSILLSVSSACDTIYWISPLGNQYITTDPILGIDTSSVDYVNGAWEIICVNATGCSSLPTIDSIRIRPQPIFPAIQGRDSVCVGDSVRLGVFPVFNASYRWMDINNTLLSNNRVTTFFDITTDTTFYLTITVNGCSANDSIDVAVYPIPVAPIPPDTIQVCEGDVLQASTITPALAYQWINPIGDTSNVGMPMKSNATLQDSGTYTLSIINMNGCITPDTTFEVIVDTLPNSPIVIDNNPCNGDSLIIVATGNDRYTWTSSTGTTFVGDTLVILSGSSDYTATWNVLGEDTITNCISTPTTYTPTIRPIPSVPIVSNSGPVCIGDSVRLFTPVIAGVNYNWSALPSGVAVGTNSNDIFVQNITNDSLFRLEVELNGCRASDTTPVLVHRQLPAPELPDSIAVCEGDTLFLTTTTVIPTNSNYNWSGPASFASNQRTPFIFPAQTVNAGIYTLTLIDTTGCPSLDSTVPVIVHPPLAAPTIFSPETSVCDGEPLVLIATSTCDSMVWVNPSNQLVRGRDTLVIQSSDINNYLAGDWNLICIDTTTGCQGISNPITFTIKTRPNPPIIAQSGPLCLGEDLNLSMALVSGASYQWFARNPTTLIDSVPSTTISGITTDTVFYGVVVVNGCDAFDSVEVKVNALPTLPNVSAVSDTICESDSLRLETSTNAVSYNWTGPNGFSSLQKDPVIAVTSFDTGFYVLTITDTSGCQATDSIRIQIDAVPLRPNITTASNVCFGDSINLEGGACDLSRWFSPIGTTLDVYGSSTLIVPIDSAEYVSGVWRVICIDTATGCVSDTSLPENITINTLPASLLPSNSGPICSNDTAVLSVLQQGALTYEWSIDTTFNSVFQTGHVASTGFLTNDQTFYVRGTTLAGCSKIDSTRVRIVPPLSAPDIFAIDTLLCEGDSIALGTTTSPYFYHWTGPNAFASNAQFPIITTVTATDSGLYTLHIEDSTGCISPDTSINIVVNPTPYTGLTILQPSNVCDGDSILLETAGTLCDSSSWIGPVQAQGGILNQTIVYSGDTNYVNGPWVLLCYDTLTGCVASSNTVFVTIDSIPPTPIASNSGPVCLGDSVELSAAISLGTTTTWYSDSTLTNQVDTGRVISVGGILTDTTFYVQQVRGNCLSPVGSTRVTLHPPTTPVVYQDTVEVCEGALIQLDVLTTGISYTWTGPNGFSSSSKDTIISNATTPNAGDYVVSIVDNNGCNSLTDTIHVIVNPNPVAPIISYSSPVCDGDDLSINISASCSLYEWTGPTGTAFVSNANPLVIPSTNPNYQDGIWEVLCIDTTTGCEALSNSLTVNITERPLAGIVSNTGPVCIGDAVNLSTTAITGVSYNWVLANATSVGTGPSTVVSSITNNTTFYLEVTTVDGCVFIVDSTTVNVFAPTTSPSISSNGPICEGDTLFLSSTTLAPTYNWSGPNGFTDTVQNPIIFGASNLDSGLYTLSIIDANGCTSSDTTLNVIINSQPNIPLITGLSTICDGDRLLLSTTGTCDSIYWISPTGVILPGRDLNIASDSSDYIAGAWQVFCVDTLTGCETGSVPVNVVIQPKFLPVVTNNGPICVGENAFLSTNFVFGSYVWFRDSAMTDTILGANGFLVGVNNLQADTTFYVVVTPLGGCASAPTPTTVIVHPTLAAPPVPSTLQVCVGEDIVLSTTATNATSYDWSGPNGFGSNQANPVITNADTTDAGIYYLTIDDPNGCPTDSAQILVTVDTLPTAPSIPSFDVLCDGDTLFLAPDSTSNLCDSMVWVGPNGPNYAVPGASAFILPNDTNYIGGLWVLRCIDTITGCFSTSNVSLVLISPLPDTQATFSNSPICIGGDAILSTNAVSTFNTYTWYSSSALDSIAGVGQNPTIPNITTDTTFYLVITNGVGCNSDPVATPVTVLPPSNAPAILADFAVCEGAPIVMTTSTLANAYFWTGPNGFVDSVQNPVVTNTATLNDTGLYTLVVLDSNGCLSADTSVYVDVHVVAAAPTITYNGPICEEDTLMLFSSGLCGQSQWIGPNGNSAGTLGSPGGNNVLWTIGSSTSIPFGNPNHLGGNWYMVCIDTVTGCQSISDTILVTIEPQPNIVAVANSGPVCSGDTINLTASVTASVPTTITWYADSSLNTLSQMNTGLTSTAIAGVNDTTFYIQAVSTNGCSSLDSTTVTVLPAPLAPILPATLNVCEGEPILLTTPTIASAYNWSGPNAYTSNLQNPTAIIANAGTAGVYTLSIVDANGCTSATSSMQVVVTPLPTAPTVSNTGPACLGDSIDLTLSPVVANASYEWFHLNTGNSVGLGSSLSLGNIAYADTGSYYVVITVNGCSATSVDTTIVSIFGGSVSAAFAGVDQVLCGTDSTLLSANPVVAPNTGIWTSSSTATILNPNDSNSDVLNLSVGINTFYWTVTSNSCNASDVDSVVINYVPISTDTAFAGIDQNVCAVTSINLAANTPSVGTGIWTQSSAQSSAGVTINNSNNPNTSVGNLQPGNNYTFVWSLSNGACGIYDTDTVFINIGATPNDNAFAGSDVIACGSDTVVLEAFNSLFGTGTWTTNTSALILNDSSANTAVTNLLQDTTIFVWSLSSGNCGVYSSDTVLVIQGGLAPIANPDNFTALSGATTTLNVLPNDVLTADWDIYINTPTINGQLLNLNNGLFDLILQPEDTSDQWFVYELCNPDCPNSCDTALVHIVVSAVGDCEPPNIFTPNEDGVNDVFEIPCLNDLVGAKLLVFNRWGDLVYETDKYNNQWDGTHEGKPLPDATYFYILKIGEGDTIQGSVEIRR